MGYGLHSFSPASPSLAASHQGTESSGDVTWFRGRRKVNGMLQMQVSVSSDPSKSTEIAFSSKNHKQNLFSYSWMSSHPYHPMLMKLVSSLLAGQSDEPQVFHKHTTPMVFFFPPVFGLHALHGGFVSLSLLSFCFLPKQRIKHPGGISPWIPVFKKEQSSYQQYFNSYKALFSWSVRSENLDCIISK